MALTGCALSDNYGQPADADTPQTAVSDMSKQQLAEELQIIRESHKKLQRLTELESDLMLLVAELAKQPTIEARPDGYRPELSTETITPDEARAPVTQGQAVMSTEPSETKSELTNTQLPPSTETSAEIVQDPTGSAIEMTANTAAENVTRHVYNSSNYMLWLGFFVSEQAANTAKHRLRNAIDFQRMRLAIEVIANANNRGQYYGLVLGPFTTFDRATSLCVALTNHGQYCQVRSNIQG